jgi:hypothetical protein
VVAVAEKHKLARLAPAVLALKVEAVAVAVTLELLGFFI